MAARPPEETARWPARHGCFKVKLQNRFAGQNKQKLHDTVPRTGTHARSGVTRPRQAQGGPLANIMCRVGVVSSYTCGVLQERSAQHQHRPRMAKGAKAKKKKRKSERELQEEQEVSSNCSCQM
eukprot:7082212-Prymnesium_polylepis.1